MKFIRRYLDSIWYRHVGWQFATRRFEIKVGCLNNYSGEPVGIWFGVYGKRQPTAGRFAPKKILFQWVSPLYSPTEPPQPVIEEDDAAAA